MHPMDTKHERKLLRLLDRERAKLANIRRARCEGCGDAFAPAYGVDRCGPCAREFREITRADLSAAIREVRAQEAGR